MAFAPWSEATFANLMQSLGKSVLVVRGPVPCRARQQRLVAADIAICQGRRWSRLAGACPYRNTNPILTVLVPDVSWHHCWRELFFVSCSLFSLAAACGAFVWIAADSRHGWGEQTRCARFCVPRRADATRGRLFSQYEAPEPFGAVPALATDSA